MSENTSQKALRKMATATCMVALLPIGLGALVTTLKAGMAFADWPSSDGQNMLLYPWLSDFRTHPDKFVEHGHRLAGVVIGLTAIALAISSWGYRGWVRRYGLFLLLAVILQGLLGGARVLLDAGTLAMTHSLTGALFFSACVVYRTLLSPQAAVWKQVTEDRLSITSVAISAILPVVVLAQYFLGGMLRHLHLLRNEHIIGAIITLICCVWVGVSLVRAANPVLCRCGVAVVSTVAMQFALGLGALTTRFGFQKLGYVSVFGSLEQAIFCSLHTVVGILLVAAAFSTSVWTILLLREGRFTAAAFSPTASSVQGGVA